MSPAAQSAVAAVPLTINVETLERRLLELRTEIDAILGQLAGCKAPPAAAESAGASEPEATATAATAPEPETTPETCVSAPDDADIPVPAPEAVDQPEAPATAETDMPPTAESPASDAPTAVASIEAAASPATDASVAGISASDGDLETASVAEAAELLAATATPTEPTAEEPAPVAAPAADGPQQATAEIEHDPADAAPATADSTHAADAAGPAETPVLAFEPRHRKQKAGYVASVTTTATRPRRRLATRVAACILALLAAATALVVADRTVVGSALSLPQMPTLPSYVPYGSAWPFLGQGAGESSVTDPNPSKADDGLPMRYREIWPSGA